MTARGATAPDLQAELARSVRALIGGGEERQRYGIAVSGGPDSMALLDLATGAFPGRVEAATLDHGLRAASADEAAMVARWCGERGVPHAILHPREAVQGNVQQWARVQRYALLNEWREERRIDWICTAHHADDQLETLIMRLNRGAGVNGLAGIRARQGQVLRPLLAVRRGHLLGYVQHQQIPYVEDPSNNDPRFDRAAVRRKLRDAGWLDPRGAARSASALADAEEALDWAVNRLETDRIRPEGDGWKLDPQGLPRELLRRIVLRLIERVDPASLSPRGESLDRALAAVARGEQVSLGAALLKGGSDWIIRPAPPRR